MADNKTTTAGALKAIGVVITGIAFMIDGDPNTIVDTQAVIGAIGIIVTAFGALFHGWFSKDK